MDITQRIFLTTVTVLVALTIGLLLRLLLVRRLRKTVLDNWLVQTLGVIVIFVLLVLSVPVVFLVIDYHLFDSLWVAIRDQFQKYDITALTWSLIETVLVIALGVGVARTLVKLTLRGLGEGRVDINIRALIRRILYIVMLIFIGLWVLSIWQVQVQVGIPVAALGILTVAVTVAIQDVLKDLFAGFYILMERPFHIGDQITIGDQANIPGRTGKVQDVQPRATKLRMLSGEEVTVPNALVFGSVVINNTFYEKGRTTFVVTLPQEEFVKEETPGLILKTLKGIGSILPEPGPSIEISGLSEKKISLAVRFWVARGQHSTATEVFYALHEALPNADLLVQESPADV